MPRARSRPNSRTRSKTAISWVLTMPMAMSTNMIQSQIVTKALAKPSIAAASGASTVHGLTSSPGAAARREAMTAGRPPVVRDRKADLGQGVADPQHRLRGREAGEGEAVLRLLVSGEQADHVVAPLRERAVGGLRHDDDALADACFEPRGEMTPENDAGVGLAGEVTPVDDPVGDRRDSLLAGGNDAGKGQRQRLVLALDDRRDAHARRPGADRGGFESRPQRVARHGHEPRHRRIVEIPLGVDLAAAEHQTEGRVAARGRPGLEQRREAQDRVEAGGHDDQRDDRAARVAPEVAPGQRREQTPAPPIMPTPSRRPAPSGGCAGRG